jgi:hypothetical protein
VRGGWSGIWLWFRGVGGWACVFIGMGWGSCKITSIHISYGTWRGVAFFIISPLLSGLAFGIFIDGWLVGWLGLRLE